MLVAAVAGAMAATAAAKTTPFAGTYTTKLAGTPVAFLNATWHLQIKADGHFVVSRNGTRVVSGLWIRHFPGGPDGVAFADQSGSGACLGKTSTGNYTWTLKKNAAGRVYLLFGGPHDSCAGRKAVLTTHPLLKIK
jgi:hypothetical protein